MEKQILKEQELKKIIKLGYNLKLISVEFKVPMEILEEYEKEHPGTKHEVNERYAKNIEQVSKNFEKQSKTLETCEFEWKNNNVVRKPKEEKNKSDEEQYTM